MRANIHRVSLAPVVTEQDLIVKEAQVNKKLQEKNINISHMSDIDLEVLGDFVNMTLHEVTVDPTQEIFSRKASKADMAKGREAMTTACPICNSDYGKKNKVVQCQFCARNCCNQCCFKSRLDPESKNATVAQKLLICEDCQDKYRNVMMNQEFRKQQMVFTRLKDQLVSEIGKIQGKSSIEKTRIENLKPKEDPQLALSRTMKIAKLKKDVQSGKKQTDKLTKDIASQKAATIKWQERAKEKEEEIKKNKIENERLRVEHLQKQEQAKKQQLRLAEEARQNQEKRIKEEERNRLEQQKKETQPTIGQLVTNQEPKEAEEQQLLKKEPQIVAGTQSKVVQTLPRKKTEEKIQETIPVAIQQPKTLTNAIKQVPIREINQVSQPALPQVIVTAQTKKPETKEAVKSSEKPPAQAKPAQIDPFADIEKTELESPNRNTRSGSNFDSVKEDISNQLGKYANSNAKLSDNGVKPIATSPAKDAEQAKPAEVLSTKTNEAKKSSAEKAPSNQVRKKSEGEVSGTHSQSISEQVGTKEKSVGQNRPVSTILEDDDQEDIQMMSKSVIVEPEHKPESKAPIRKPSKNMTEKEILSMKIPPPMRAQKLFKEGDSDSVRDRVSSKGKLNASLKQSITEEPKVTPTSEKQLTKEEILRKSRNEDLQESQTPGVDQKSKCSCLLF